MIEVRTFEGTAQELATFSSRVFQNTYAGRHLAPVYAAEHFDRDLLADGKHPDLLIAAYDGARLVGIHPAKPKAVRLHGQESLATWGSYFSVEQDYRKRGVAFRMQAEYVRRHIENGIDVNYGFVWGRSKHALGPQFWSQLPRDGVRRIAHLGVWVRPLDHEAIAAFEFHRRDVWGARALSVIQGKPKRPDDVSGLREFRPSDIKDCVALLNDAATTTDLAYLWDEDSAALQLSFPNLSKTIVFDDAGVVKGLVNYTLIDVLGRKLMRFSRVDAVNFDASVSRYDRRRLLREAHHAMSMDGAKGCFMLRGTWDFWRDFVATGYVPTPPEYSYIALTLKDGLPERDVNRLSVLLL